MRGPFHLLELPDYLQVVLILASYYNRHLGGYYRHIGFVQVDKSAAWFDGVIIIIILYFL